MHNHTNIRILLCDSNYYFISGVVALIKTILGSNKNITINGDISIPGIQEADIIIMNSPPTLPCICLTNFHFRQCHCLVIALANRHSHYRFALNASCFRGALLLHHNETVEEIQKRLEQKIKASNAGYYSFSSEDCQDCCHCRLSKKQLQLVEYMRQGYSFQRMAKMMNVSVKTIYGHKNRIMEKLGIKGNARLCNFINSTEQHKFIADISQIEKFINTS